MIDKFKKEYFGIVGTSNDSVFYLIKNPKDSLEFGKKDYLQIVSVDEDNFLRGKKIPVDLFSSFNGTFINSLPLKKKFFYSSNSNLIFNSFHYGISSRMSISLFLTPVFAPAAAVFRYSIPLNDHFYITPEIGFGSGSWLLSKIKAFNFAIRGTQGNSQKNISSGVGYFHLDGISSYFRGIPIGDSLSFAYVNFGYKNRFSKRFSLSFDLWYFNSTILPVGNFQSLKTDFFLSGIFFRSHFVPRRQWRFGALIFINRGQNKSWRALPIPVIQYSRVFGK